MPSQDLDFRLCLEGRAERLEIAQVRLTALAQMLRAFRWRSRLRENTALLLETAAAQPAVEEALLAVARRAKVEKQPPRHPVLRLAADVERLSKRVAALALKRLGPQSQADDLPQRLQRLELSVLTEPRLILPGRRWKTAQQVWPASHPDVQRVGRFAQVLEPLFKRPMQSSPQVPFTPDEVDALASVWEDGQAALDSLWARVERIDAAGTLTAYLRRRASSLPAQPPQTGAEHVVAGEFWNNFARGRLNELTQPAVAPITCTRAEQLEVVRWLVQRKTNDDARLSASNGLSDSRAGLLELAVELSTLSPRPRVGERSWLRLTERAQRAEAAAGEADYQKLHDNLRLFVGMLHRDHRSPPVYRPLATLPHEAVTGSTSLVDLISAMKDKME